tara:strand:+ start:18 stop:572 length:555 start_codon:yes stop_codon:yes gene_type:complete
MTASRGLPFTATHGMIDRVHGHATDTGSPALPAVSTRFADGGVLVFGISHGSYGRTTKGLDEADFPTGHLESRLIALDGHKACTHASRTSELGPSSGKQFDAMHASTNWDVSQRHGVARFEIHEIVGTDKHIAFLDSARSGHIAFGAVLKLEENDMGCAIGVVLDGFDSSRHIKLGSPEINFAI